jgi:histidinol dehydrogenase
VIEVILSHEKDRLQRKLQRLRERNVALDAGLMRQVESIIDEVRKRGDAALLDYAAQFDRHEQTASELRVNVEILERCAAQADEQVVEALAAAARNVRRFHEHERPSSWEVLAEPGARLGQRITPIDCVGLYVPGGTAAYPSSVVMNVVPAQVAGVKRIIVATPPRSLQENPAVAAALLQLGITEVYAVGGAQAIAALAYGTETVPRVDKITGPGNRFVAAAKKLVFGAAGIDSIAGPTEVVIVADDTACARFVAADMLAQAEHAEDASAVLLTTSEQLGEGVAAEIQLQILSLPRRAVVEESLRVYGAIVVCKDLDEAGDLVNEMAPEHLEIVARDDEAVAERIRHAGAIFFGAHTPEALGDYFAGPNHVLPTAGTARFASALSVWDFVRRTSTMRYSRAALEKSVDSIATLARAEGLDAHARSVEIRLE